jgi:hypothetical protein
MKITEDLTYALFLGVGESEIKKFYDLFENMGTLQRFNFRKKIIALFEEEEKNNATEQDLSRFERGGRE